MDTFQRLVDSLDGLTDLKRVVFTGFGEPLTHPNILEMIEAVRKRDLAVRRRLQRVAAQAGRGRELVKLGVDRLVVSVDGAKPETYAEIRGAMLAQVLGNLRGLNEAKRELGSLFPALGIEFVVLKSNLAELAELTGTGFAVECVSRPRQQRAALHGRDARRNPLRLRAAPAFQSGGWPVKADAWVMWGTLELPRMHWGAERRCRFVQDKSLVVGWDGGVAPCYALSHNYSYYA